MKNLVQNIQLFLDKLMAIQKKAIKHKGWVVAGYLFINSYSIIFLSRNRIEHYVNKYKKNTLTVYNLTDVKILRR